jgi:glycosyltransferase involved in cell wall biosynthesis
VNSNPQVSVVLPVYNGERFVADAVKSICNQTWSDWELLIVDDGSSDGSLELCHQLAAHDPRIAVYSNPVNMGLAKTMNRLVSLAKGRYIAVQEQDDISMPARLAIEVEILEACPEVGLVSGIAAWLDDDAQIFNYFPGLLQNGKQFPQEKSSMVEFLYVNGCKVVNAACMFRTKLTTSIPGPFDEDAIIPDWQFFLHVAHQWRIWGIPQVLVHMRRGSQHQHVTANKQVLFTSLRDCIRTIYREYNQAPGSPIDYAMYRRAMAAQLILEGRYFGRLQGALRLTNALIHDPFNHYAWHSLGELMSRGLSKLVPKKS